MRRALICLCMIVLVLSAQAAAFSSPPSLNRIASKLAGRKVTIRCLTKQETLIDPIFLDGTEAYVEVPNPYAVFKYGHCENLLALLAGDASGITLNQLTWSILVLIHESGHMRNVSWARSEPLIQCWAMQHFRAGLKMLGVHLPIAQSLIIWEAIEIHNNGLALGYKKPGCKLPRP